jgi:hypothetical protein
VSSHQDQTEEKFVRLSVNLGPETAEDFKELTSQKGLSITDGIRRAISLWKFFEDETKRGNRIAIVYPDGTTEKVRFL